jgi:hypothetical protein
MSRRARKVTRTRSDRQQERKIAQDARIQSVTLALGYGIVGLSVIGGFILSFRPQALGLQGAPPAAAFALAALACFRLYALRLEIRRQARQTAPGKTSSAKPPSAARASGRRV